MVALIAVLVGAGGMFAGLRVLGRGSATSAATSSGQKTGATQPDAMPGMDTSGANAGRPANAGNKAVQISSERQQLIGVRTATVEHRALDTTVRTVGTLAYDETRVTQIHTKIAGWVERLYVDYVGKNVKRGEPLFTVYSPDLVSTQKEYLLALKARAQLSASQFAETRSGAESLVSSARERLRLWDISDAQVEELERTGEPRKTLTLYSPFSGIVLERNAFAGQYLTPEMSTFKIADLSTIWVLGQVFEYELQSIKLGQDAQVEFPYGQSTRTLKGRVTFIYPEIDPQTRRAKVRIEFQNPGLEFKPQTYVTVILKTPGGHQLAIPKEAVIDNGSKQYAILALPNGYFDPREIKVGPAVDDAYPVVSGLNAGDRVVTSAQFLVDSETNLQSALGAMSMNMPGMNSAGSKPAGEAPKAGENKDDSMKGMQMPATPASPPAPKR
jgi:RND family efflux transporter MFP subunit